MYVCICEQPAVTILHHCAVFWLLWWWLLNVCIITLESTDHSATSSDAWGQQERKQSADVWLVEPRGSEAQSLTSSYVQGPVLFPKLNDSFHKLLATFLFQSASWTENCYFIPLISGSHSREDLSLFVITSLYVFLPKHFFWGLQSKI